MVQYERDGAVLEFWFSLGVLVQSVIYILDDDSIARWMYEEMLQGIGARIRSYEHAHAFLDEYRPQPSECLICDLRMPEIGGLEVQRQLLSKEATLPIIFITGHSEVPSAVEALQNGAFHFLEKPVNSNFLIETVQKALIQSRELNKERVAQSTRDARLTLLTDKERQVATRIVSGLSNREIAEEMGLSPRTVENHRANLMQKLHVGSLAELIKLFL